MPISGAHLSGALNPLSSHTREQRGKKKPLASWAAPDSFLDSLLASCGTLAPFRLRSRSQPQSSPWDLTKARASAPSSRPPRRVNRQASWAGGCWSALILCAGISLLCPPHPCCCSLLCGSEPLPLRHPQSPPAKWFPSVWKPFLLHSSLPLVQVLSLFFLSVFSFLFCPTQVRGEFLAFWEVWGLLPAFSRCSVGVVPHVDVFLMYLWEEVSSMSFYSTVLISSPYALCWEYIWYLNSRRYCTMLYPQGFVILPFRSICIIYLELIFYSMR